MKNYNSYPKRIYQAFAVTLSGLTFCLFILIITSCSSSDGGPDLPFSDDFNNSSLNSGWIWQNEPTQWDVGNTKQGWLTIHGKQNANIFCDDNSSLLYQVLEESKDFDVSTKLYCEWGINQSDVAGIIIKFPSADEWILIKLWMHGNGTGRLEWQTNCNDIISPVPDSESSGGKTEIYLRIQKVGNNYTGYFKTTSGASWTMISTEAIDESLPMHLGLFAGIDTGGGELLVQFDYFD